ncbi:MAG: hypothetical protein F4Z75_05115 [Synechococcus sp. SB0668_bin_15]|nr:hypothetical protein [Synechococcus sp. SB0668_bin_15]MXZ82486.1 hypothetical protein [Synechococcus sp. SB0666_bin_14]MYA91476.1 hypothetical protein [Synechococcus sp. SB0663_bin_10]MYC49779.1 hypothetical protein [Synechococcus sp. SB0662_bin_14]MYG46285.1 hypothetical protein [Synechococcus sp. SB0675_bin_6]MYJ59912.1 hypothetical protein [Synechococcus sp. SB0672_bin_6]MYK91394.1 hypothetical protein [Synechococcus sp. SB0669_bin_8]
METLLLVGVAVLFLVGAVLLQRRRQLPGKQAPPGPDPVQGGLQPSPSPGQPAVLPVMGQSRPPGPRQRRQMLRYLKSAYDKGANARLAAMEDMVAWGHPACLPLLRRGLRDADLRVVGLAARGLERFRGPRQRLRRLPRGPRRHRGSRPSPPA